MAWYHSQPEPGSRGEPQAVRDAWDKHLQAQREAGQEPEPEPS